MAEQVGKGAPQHGHEPEDGDGLHHEAGGGVEGQAVGRELPEMVELKGKHPDAGGDRHREGLRHGLGEAPKDGQQARRGVQQGERGDRAELEAHVEEERGPVEEHAEHDGFEGQVAEPGA
ncbi:hypothetical protein D3C72_1841560 [compost metagenome]